MWPAMATVPFQLIIKADYEAVSREAAERMACGIEQKPDLLLCLATGSSPMRAYQLLAGLARDGRMQTGRLRILKLDEWAGLPMDHPGTCEAYLRRHVLGPLAVSPGRYEGFVSDAGDPAGECARVARWLDDNGPIDLCILGLGGNGHLGLNEPGASLEPHAHVARLTPATQAHPMLAGCQPPPACGLTLGMADILRSRRVLLLVSGEHKATALRQLMRGPISTEFPASMLRLHSEVMCLCDRSAASALTADTGP